MARSDYSQLFIKTLVATQTPFTTDPKRTHFMCFILFIFFPYTTTKARWRGDEGEGGVQEARRRRNATSHSKNELYLIKKGGHE